MWLQPWALSLGPRSTDVFLSLCFFLNNSPHHFPHLEAGIFGAPSVLLGGSGYIPDVQIRWPGQEDNLQANKKCLATLCNMTPNKLACGTAGPFPAYKLSPIILASANEASLLQNISHTFPSSRSPIACVPCYPPVPYPGHTVLLSAAVLQGLLSLSCSSMFPQHFSLSIFFF